MTPLLEQFISEARDVLQVIGENLMRLEDAPTDKELMNELFRSVHTLKGNSGLFEFPEMTRVLHAGEDLMDAVRDDRVVYSRELADRLLDAMDFVGILCGKIEANEGLDAAHFEAATNLAESLLQLIPVSTEDKLRAQTTNSELAPIVLSVAQEGDRPWGIGAIPEAERMAAYRRTGENDCFLLHYTPASGCFYHGEDPFYQARQTPEILWGGVSQQEPWPRLEELDAYHCIMAFHILTTASREELVNHYRYVLDQVRMIQLSPLSLALPQGDPIDGHECDGFLDSALGDLREGRLSALTTAAKALLELAEPDRWFSSALRWLLVILEKEPENRAAIQNFIESLRTLHSSNSRESSINHQPPVHAIEMVTRIGPTCLGTGMMDLDLTKSAIAIVALQKEILSHPIKAPWQKGRLRAAAATISACLKTLGDPEALSGWDRAATAALAVNNEAGLITWLDEQGEWSARSTTEDPLPPSLPIRELIPTHIDIEPAVIVTPLVPTNDGDVKFGRRAEDSTGMAKSLKVDQVKIDRLMNLIGEMVVSKNALPYLAGRAETVYGVRELSREIKAQYTVINRIAEEMQDAIMQVRMMPVSFVFQRFPRLVRDTSRKLGKEVNLALVGEDTEADKNIIEALGDPLVHIVRNSLDHGFELPEVRRAAGKPTAGTLTIRASQESGRVLIEVQDDGKGIDPIVIKRKAYERGVIDESTLERISDQDAINLIFAPGLSTAEVVSNLSGRGVGMDVVRAAVEKVNGTVHLESEQGKGTRLCLSLPLTMAVTNVMIIESDGQMIGVPMDSVIETVRIPRSRIQTIKKSQVTMLRGRIVALKSLNVLLKIPAVPKTNADDELAVLVVRIGEDRLGLVVDDFHETVDIILKPLDGILAGMAVYSGSALMGDGSVLMVLNVKEIF